MNQKHSLHPAQHAVEGQISPFEGDYKLTATFSRDTDLMRLFGRKNKVVIAITCTLNDEFGNCISKGSGVSFISYQGDRQIERAILYARNSSLIDCAMKASKLSTIFLSDEEGSPEQVNAKAYQVPAESKPSDKQVNYLKSLMETLPGNEQNDLMTRLPQMSKYDVSQLINSLKLQTA